jgi:hypothetical protein
MIAKVLGLAFVIGSIVALALVLQKLQPLVAALQGIGT